MIWRPIPGEEFYEASDTGCVRRIDAVTRCYSAQGKPFDRFVPGRILKPVYHPRSGLKVYLSDGGKCKTRLVHRLVLAAFRGESDRCGHHLDGDKTNNKLSNLVYIEKRAGQQSY